MVPGGFQILLGTWLLMALFVPLWPPWTECLQESSLGLPFEAEGREGCRGMPESQAPPVLALGHQSGPEGFLVQPGVFERLRPSICKCLWWPGLS